MNTETTNINLFAFWKYDQFPYVLGSYVNKLRNDGIVYAPAYQGWFHPVKILPIKVGEFALTQLKELTTQYKKEQEQVNKIFTKNAQEILAI